MFQARWWPWHLLCACVVAALAFLGYWQMQVAFNPGEWHGEELSIRNFVYALQWWVFAVFALWFWYRYMRDQREAELGVAAEDRAIARAKTVTSPEEGGTRSSNSPGISLDAPAAERRKQIFGEQAKSSDTDDSDTENDRDSGSEESI